MKVLVNKSIQPPTRVVSSIASRKATSTQKERWSSTKLTTGIGGRDVTSNKGFRSTDKLFAKRLSNNSHPLKQPAKRPVTDTNKKHNFVHRPMTSDYSKQKENFNRTINSKRASDAVLASQSRLKKQKSTEFTGQNPLSTSKTPNVMKRKAELLNSNSDTRQLNAEEPYDSTYTASRVKKHDSRVGIEHDESVSSIATPLSGSIKGRSTATPSRYGFRSR